MTTCMQEHSLLTPHQSGFRPGHSTQDVLINTMDDWHKELDSDRIVLALFVDLSKAFNTIDHELLLEKLDMFFRVRNEEKCGFRPIWKADSRGLSVDTLPHHG